MSVSKRSKYTDEERARVLLELTTNNGNVKKTARDTNVPENTVRRWRDEWEREGVPEPVLTVAVKEADDFIEKAETVRDQALEMMRSKLPEARPGELNAIVGTLDDKITRARGLPTQRVKHEHDLPSPAETREIMRGLIQEAISDANQRHLEIAEVIDGEIVEPAALPSGE